MIIKRKKQPFSNGVYVRVCNDIFTTVTERQIERVVAVVEQDLDKGRRVTVASYDWRIVLTLKLRYPIVFTVLLLPDLVFYSPQKAVVTKFHERYAKKYFFHQSFYGKDCDWFFTYNPKKYFLNLSLLRKATGADWIKVTKSTRKTVLGKSFHDVGRLFHSYAQYSFLSRSRKWPTCNYKFKSHLVSLADYFQMADKVNNLDGHRYLLAIENLALRAEIECSNDHRKGIEFFYDGVTELGEPPGLASFKSLWHLPVALNKLSDIYAATGRVKDYLVCKKMQLGQQLGIPSTSAKFLSDGELLDAFFSYLQREISSFKKRNRKDQEFSDLVKNSSVAIVGPAPTTHENGEEIDAHDNVVRFRFPNIAADEVPYIGSKTTILNTSLAFSRKASDRLGYNDDFFVTYQSALPHCNVNERSRVLFEVGNNLLTMPPAVPRVLIDILYFSPAKIKIYSSTMMLDVSGSSHRESYLRSVVNSSSIAYESSFKQKRLAGFYHDHVVHFFLMKSMFLSGFFEVDDNLLEVISMDAESYLHHLLGSTIIK